MEMMQNGIKKWKIKIIRKKNAAIVSVEWSSVPSSAERECTRSTTSTISGSDKPTTQP
jgi:hypothetical protein